MIDRYGLHLKVIHNDVTDRLAQLLKQCSYYLQQQQKPMEVSIGKVYICKYHVTLLLNYYNVDIRIRVTGVSYLYWFSVIPVCTIVFSHVLHILYRQHVRYFIVYLNGIFTPCHLPMFFKFCMDFIYFIILEFLKLLPPSFVWYSINLH